MTAKINPQQAIRTMKEAGYQPLEDYPGSSIPWLCICKRCGNQVAVRRSHIVAGRVGCKFCAKNSRSQKQRRDSKSTIALMENAGLQPLEEYVNSDKPWKSKCLKCGKIVSPTFSHIKQGRGGCNFCAKKMAGVKQRIPSEAAIKIMLTAGFQPLVEYRKNDAPWKCKCLTCGRISTPSLAHVKSRNGRCKFCAGVVLASDQVRERFRDLSLKPLEPYKPGTPIKCQCLKCGSYFYVKLSSVSVSRGRGACTLCGLEKRSKARQLPQAVAYDRFLAAGLEPIGTYKNSKTKWQARCIKCKAIDHPVPEYVFAGQGGCSNCASYGIKMSAPSYIYILKHSVYDALKIGIGNVASNPKNDRIKKLRRDGWNLIQKYDCDTGQIALNVESKVLQLLREDMKIPQYLSKEQLKQRGETETMCSDLITAKQLQLLVRKTLKSENS